MMKKQILCVAAGIVLCLAASQWSKQEARIADGYLERGEYGEEPEMVELVAEGIQEEEIACQVELHARQYRAEEADQLLDTLIARLPEQILGSNVSLDEVRTNLNLIDAWDEYGVQIRWFSEEPELLNSFGEIMVEDRPKEGMPVVLTAELILGEVVKETRIEVCILPRILSKEERTQEQLQRMLVDAEKEHPEQGQFFLPTEYQGKHLYFRYKQDQSYYAFLVLGILAAVLLSVKERQDEEQKQTVRNRRLLLEYADLVYQLMIFTGAGLTVGSAWAQIVKNYRARCPSAQRELHPAYEELSVVYDKMQCGMTEGEAIDEFGRNCGVQQYRKLSTLLNQNRRLGTKNLQMMLEQEMTEAWELQKNMARCMGEEAGTKLLAPLFLMLLIVMVMIMVPAMLAMG